MEPPVNRCYELEREGMTPTETGHGLFVWLADHGIRACFGLQIFLDPFGLVNMSDVLLCHLGGLISLADFDRLPAFKWSQISQCFLQLQTGPASRLRSQRPMTP